MNGGSSQQLTQEGSLSHSGIMGGVLSFYGNGSVSGTNDSNNGGGSTGSHANQNGGSGEDSFGNNSLNRGSNMRLSSSF